VKIEFSHSADDLVEATDALAAGWRERKKLVLPETDPRNLAAKRLGVAAFVMFGLGLAMILGACLFLTFERNPAWIAAIILVLYFLFFFVRAMRPAAKRRDLRKNFAENKHNTDPTTVEIDDGGLHYLTENWQCHVQWKSIQQFYSTAGFFLLTDDSPATFVIPKRAFANLGLQEEFDRLVREQMTRAGLVVY
jgi:hypothetical protein